MRFLVWDDHNDKLIGIFALGDPVFNLRVRDREIGWTTKRRRQALVNVMDAYVLGSLPPYSLLLGGKLVACLTNAIEVQTAFAQKYEKHIGVISGEAKRPRLLAITTTSSLGRSSIYNRLKLGSRLYFRRIGFTAGWGHFHLPDHIFELMRALLKRRHHTYATKNRFGDGPNWRLRTIRAALEAAELDPATLQHGVQREVYISEIVSNAKEVLSGTGVRPYRQFKLSAAEISGQARDRWLIPRGARYPEFREYRVETLRGQHLCVDPTARHGRLERGAGKP
jgi:hypothetical protein